MGQFLPRLARRIIGRTGTNARVEELNAHFDELEANGETLSPLDIASLAMLAVRSLPVKAIARSFMATYGTMMMAAIAAWWIATWTGSIRGVENFLEELLALESFRFGGISVLALFSVVAAAITGALVIATRTTVFRAYAMVILIGFAAAIWATVTGTVQSTEEFLRELFATDFRISWPRVALWYAVLSLPLVASFVILARQSFVRAYAMTLLTGVAAVTALALTGSIAPIETFLGELMGVEGLRIHLSQVALAYALVLLAPIAVFTTFTRLAGRQQDGPTAPAGGRPN